MSGIVQNNILRTSGSIAVAAAGLNWSSTILTALTTFTVTVGNPGAGNRYYIDTVLQATVNLLEGFTYKFDQSDSSNSGHPLRFSTTSGGSHSGGSEYTTGVTTSGTPGSSGAYTQIVVASGAPVLYYYCTAHSGMGGTANTTAETVEAGNGYWIDTTSTTCTITLPSAAEKGDQIVLIDYARTWGTNAITIDSNGLNYQGNDDTYVVEYTTSGQSVNIVYSDATKGWVPLEDDVTADATSPPPTQRAIFGYGTTGSVSSLTNLVNSSGVVGNDVTGVGTARVGPAAASYGGDKAIFGYGDPDASSTGKTNISNKVSNSGVVASDTTGVGTARKELSATGYGVGLALFYGGAPGSAAIVGMTNLVNSSGVVATDTTKVGTARKGTASVRYGVGTAIAGFGNSDANGNERINNLISDTGVMASDTTGVGTKREYLAATSYGSGLAIFGYGDSGSNTNVSNKVNSSGVVASDTTGVGTARYGPAAANYGGDKGIFGYGNASGHVSMTNLVSNSGVISSDVTGVGTARSQPAAAGYSYSA